MKYATVVDYTKIDPLKVSAQKAAKKTAGNLPAHFKEVEASRGESAYVVDAGNFYLASIVECLGTKALVADAVRKITGKTYYGNIAQDTIAMAVNDILTVGAKPISLSAYWAAGKDNWFQDAKRCRDLIRGWKKACDLAQVAWGGGETPALSGVIYPKAVDLACACVGIVKPKSRLILGQKLTAGDAIILLESSGIHANGLSLARKIAERLPEGYATKITDAKMYGEALLKPTIMYARLIENLLKAGIKIHYMSNITGHGWRKIMRHSKNFTYRIVSLPPLPSVFAFIIEKGELEMREAYGSLNMGAGFAIFTAWKDTQKTLALCQKNGFKAYLVGKVEPGPKQVIIEPLQIIFKGSSLGLRG